MSTSRENHSHFIELSVYGFIRKQYKAENEISWPIDITNICLMYFALTDEWNQEISATEMKIDSKQNSVSSPEQLQCDSWSTFGTIKIGKDDIKTWRFKNCSYGAIYLGVVDCTKYENH